MPEETVQVTLKLKDSLSAGLRKAETTFRAFGTKASSALASVRRAAFSLRGAIAGIAIGAFIKSSIRAFTDQEKSIASMEQAMKSMGRYTPELSKDMQALASSIQAVGVSGDEATLEGIKFLVTYKKIGNDLLPRATRAMADLAALTGKDMASAANILGKASEGMVGELSRYGITISDAAKKSKDFNLILADIESQVKGQQEALRKTGYGGLQAFSNTLGDLQEKIGEVFVKVLSPAIQQLTKDAEGAGASLQDKVYLGLKNVTIAAGYAADGMKVVGMAVTGLGIAANRAFAIIVRTAQATLVNAKNQLMVAHQLLAIGGKLGLPGFAAGAGLASKGLEKITSMLAEGDKWVKDLNKDYKDLTGTIEELRFGSYAEEAELFFKELEKGDSVTKKLKDSTNDLITSVETLVASRGMGGKSAIEEYVDMHEARVEAIQKTTATAAAAATGATGTSDKKKAGQSYSVSNWFFWQDTAKAIRKANEEARQHQALLQRIRDTAKDYANMLSEHVLTAIEDAVEGTFEWEAALRAVLKDIGRMAFRAVAQYAITAAFGAEKGGVFPAFEKRIPMRAYAQGGVTRGPELALIGEGRDQEAVLPLKRGRDGKLGVAMAGAGAGGETYNINIQALDAQSVESLVYSKRGIFAGAVARARRDNPTMY